DGGIALGRDRTHEVHVRHIEPEQRAVAAPRRGLAAHAARVPFGDRPEERPVETRDHHVGGGAPWRGVGLLERVAGLAPGVIGQVPVDGDAVQPQLGGRGGAGRAHRVAADAVILRRNEQHAPHEHPDDHDGPKGHDHRYALLRLQYPTHTSLVFSHGDYLRLRRPISMRSESWNTVAPAPLRLRSDPAWPRTMRLMRATWSRLAVTAPVES